MATDKDASAKVILVHGTWGKKSDWTFPTSPLAERLAVKIPTAVIERFEWSGANRHRLRDVAADRVRDRFDQSDAPTLIVAHSHGGNVSEMALASEGGRYGNVRLVTVGTPFLRYRDRVLTSALHDRPILAMARLIWLVFSLMVGLAFAVGMTRLDSEPTNRDTADRLSTWEELNPFSREVAELTVGIVLSALGLVAGVILVAVGVAVASRFSRWQSYPGGGFFASGMASIVGEGLPPITVIRTTGDEAAATLRFGTALASLTDRARSVFDRITTGLGGATLFFALGTFLFVAEGDVAVEDAVAATAAIFLQMVGALGSRVHQRRDAG